MDLRNILALAHRYQLDPAAVAAVAQVESGGGSGYQPSGKLTVLFEAHLFYAQLKKAGRDADALALQYPRLISRKWNRALYEGGSAENRRLAEAIAIDPCAWLCASYGKFQILGANYSRCGFNTVHDFIQALKAGEASQLQVWIQFVSSSPAMYKALKNRDWLTFAALYNGPGYARNRYDMKLAKAYAKLKPMFASPN